MASSGCAPNGVVTDYVYDSMNRLDTLTHYAPDETPENLADNDKLAEFDYEVRADGKRTEAVEKFWVDDGESIVEVTNEYEWTYDELGRLTDEVFTTDAGWPTLALAKVGGTATRGCESAVEASTQLRH